MESDPADFFRIGKLLEFAGALLTDRIENANRAESFHSFANAYVNRLCGAEGKRKADFCRHLRFLKCVH